MAAITRHWSTFLNGLMLDETAFRKEVDQIMNYVKSQSAGGPRSAAEPENIKRHLKQHQKYPASKADLVASCYNLRDLSANDKKWFVDMLPEGTYRSAEQVITTLGLK